MWCSRKANPRGCGDSLTSVAVVEVVGAAVAVVVVEMNLFESNADDSVPVQHL